MNKMIGYLKFLEEHKYLVGLSDYTIMLADKIEKHSNIAEASVDIFEKLIKVNLYKDFIDSTPKFQKETLLHELIHARLNIALQEQNQITKFIEEDFVNDITRGLMTYDELQSSRIKIQPKKRKIKVKPRSTRKTN